MPDDLYHYCKKLCIEEFFKIKRIMNNIDKQYLHLLDDVLKNGVLKPNRTGTGAYSVFGRILRCDLSKGFPLLTTKHVHFKSIVHELLWFLKGESNISYLQDNGITIWDEWADEKGNLGPVYGTQWRAWHGIEWVEPKRFEWETPVIDSKLNCRSVEFGLNESGLVGEVFSNKYGDFQVIREYRLSEEDRKGHIAFDVLFLNTNYIAKNVKKDKLLNGNIKDKYFPSVVGVACIGEYENDEYHQMLYCVWCDMIRRCYDSSNINYKNYGAKKVFVDQKWLIYANFLKDIKQIPNWILKKEFPDKYSLDLLCSNKYSKETCIWATKKEQSFNTRRNKPFIAISPSGKEYVWYGVKFFAEKYGFCETMISQCLSGECKSHKNWHFKPIEIQGKIPRLKIVDQIHQVIAGIKNTPESRRLLVTAWNPIELSFMALPPCHYSFSFEIHDNKLSCIFNMRSIDVLLGLPFNIASFALLTHLIASVCNLDVGELIWIGADVHLYENHIEQAKLQLSRKPYPLPSLTIDQLNDIDDVRYHHIELHDYQHHPKIKAPIAV